MGFFTDMLQKNNRDLRSHNPAAARGNELASIVHAADGIALMSGIGAGIDGMLQHMLPDQARL